MSVDPRAAIGAAQSSQPVLVFLGGPNGAGKTTFFEECLTALGLPFVNADRVAGLLRRADPGTASDDLERRAFMEAERLRAAFVEARLSFCTESVFSDPARAKLGLLEEARARGFAVILIFVGLESADLSIGRVKQRVEAGGHDVPDAKLRARFPRTLRNLKSAIPIADEAFLFDNSSYDQPYRPVAVYDTGRLVSRRPPFPAWTRGLPGLA